MKELVIADGCRYSRDCHKTQLNNNVLVIGATGCGKTRHIVTPNLMQAAGSYVVVDPKGTLYETCGDYLREHGYAVQKLNFAHPDDRDSLHWNPLSAILTDQDVTSMAHALTFMDGNRTADRFWDETTVALLSSLIGYLKRYVTEDAQTLKDVQTLLNMGTVNNDFDDDAPLDYLIKDIKEKDPDSYIVRMYESVRLGVGRTWRGILVSAAAKIAPFTTDTMSLFLSSDDKAVYLSRPGLEKTALFIVVSDTDRSLDPLVNLFFEQLLQTLTTAADGRPEHRLPQDVTLILDDFATNCRIHNFPQAISSIRSRGISAMVIIQDLTQLYMRYGAEGHTVIANCDTICYMGGQDMDTAETIARRAGVKESDVLSMQPGQMWVFRRGQQPVLAERLPAVEPQKEKTPARPLLRAASM